MRRPVVGLALFVAAISVSMLSARAQDFESRIDTLLSRMTLEEKVGQLNLISHGPPLHWNEISEGRIGAVLNFNNAQDVARAQKLAAQTRLQIPLLFGLDVLHGFRTQFPVPIGEAAAFNPSLSKRAAFWSAREAAHVGVQWTYAPVADLARDPRWGRVVEGFGEDPYLGEVLTAARVEGFRAGGLMSAVKHFAGYGAPEGGRDYDSTFIPPTQLRDLYLPPFRAALRAGAMTVMAGFNALNGVPNTANGWLLNDVLRREWGFTGFVTSDWGAIHELLAHGVAKDPAEAARKALLAGVDMDMMSGFYVRYLPDQVRSGQIAESVIDEAVRRVLRVKFSLGLFDRPAIDPSHTDAVFPSTESRQASREIAQESFVLLRNEGQTLPLRSSIRSLAVVGPLADAPRAQLGPHAARGHAEDSVSILQGIRNRAQNAGIDVSYAAGCDLYCTVDSQFTEAVAQARSADLVLAVMGEAHESSGEAASRTSLRLLNRQAELLDALIATGKPVVLVLVAGRPIELGRVEQQLSGLLMAWFPGTEGGTAVADVLFGDVSPSGKLPFSYPRTAGQLPLSYNRLPTGRPELPDNRYTLGYLDEELSPLFPFGFGMSYTRFSLSEIAIEKTQLRPGEPLRVSALVTNAGSRQGQEVVQLYIRDPVASRSRPVRELKAFSKIALAPQKSQKVTFEIPQENLGFSEEDGSSLVEAGGIDVFLGTSSVAPKVGEVEILEDLRIAPRKPF